MSRRPIGKYLRHYDKGILVEGHLYRKKGFRFVKDLQQGLPAAFKPSNSVEGIQSTRDHMEDFYLFFRFSGSVWRTLGSLQSIEGPIDVFFIGNTCRRSIGDLPPLGVCYKREPFRRSTTY